MLDVGALAGAEVVEDQHSLLTCDQRVGDVRTDEPGPTSNQISQARLLLIAEGMPPSPPSPLPGEACCALRLDRARWRGASYSRKGLICNVDFNFFSACCNEPSRTKFRGFPECGVKTWP